jgi:bacterial/archaeal transporter family protein
MWHESSSAPADALSPDHPTGKLEEKKRVRIEATENALAPPPICMGLPHSPAADPQPNNRISPIQMVRSAASASFRTKWFWYSMASCVCWTVWAFTARLASQEIPPATTQFISAFGFLLVVVVLTKVNNIRVTIQGRGSWYALIGGLLLACGGIALYGAYRTGYDASVVTATTSLYPVVTVFFAVLLLRERPNRFQVLGIVFAIIAIVLLSR